MKIWKKLTPTERRLQARIKALEAEVKHLRQHRDWLFQTTNRYLERARAAEQKLQNHSKGFLGGIFGGNHE